MRSALCQEACLTEGFPTKEITYLCGCGAGGSSALTKHEEGSLRILASCTNAASLT